MARVVQESDDLTRADALRAHVVNNLGEYAADLRRAGRGHGRQQQLIKRQQRLMGGQRQDDQKNQADQLRRDDDTIDLRALRRQSTAEIARAPEDRR